MEKSAHIELFTADLIRRDAEAKKMQYYCTHLTTWAMEGYDRFVSFCCFGLVWFGLFCFVLFCFVLNFESTS